MPAKRLILLPTIALLIGNVIAGCSARAGGSHDLQMVPIEQMPPDVRAAPVVVQEAYQFAFANPDIMKQIPCYCGCGAMGHASNYACYAAGADADGVITYDPHALGCSICVDITQDTMRLLGQGKSVQEIKAYVDSTYSRYGPSNMP